MRIVQAPVCFKLDWRICTFRKLIDCNGSSTFLHRKVVDADQRPVTDHFDFGTSRRSNSVIAAYAALLILPSILCSTYHVFNRSEVGKNQAKEPIPAGHPDARNCQLGTPIDVSTDSNTVFKWVEDRCMSGGGVQDRQLPHPRKVKRSSV